MAITNTGRIFHWRFEMQQNRRIWDYSTVEYNVSNFSRVLHVKDIREITAAYSDSFYGKTTAVRCHCCRAYSVSRFFSEFSILL